ncbi:RNA polymerase sigma factor [Glaciecola siphonariae]|uniref:RNA polymerase sigma factor n=1 Tax=Glaciecola siphonariae TaxID=521012 RepID=A0ABV9LQD5_9ALTE
MPQHPDIKSLLNEYAPLMARIASTHEVNPSLREDLIQDISLAVWRGLSNFRGEASVKTFIAKVAHNRCVDHVLREMRYSKSIDTNQDIDDTLAAQAQQNEHLNDNKRDAKLDFMTALHRLNLGYRQVITMQLEGFTQAEIAGVLGINEAAVAKRASRARTQLESML